MIVILQTISKKNMDPKYVKKNKKLCVCCVNFYLLCVKMSKKWHEKRINFMQKIYVFLVGLYLFFLVNFWRILAEFQEDIFLTVIYFPVSNRAHGKGNTSYFKKYVQRVRGINIHE